jgi:hypothetical protein
VTSKARDRDAIDREKEKAARAKTTAAASASAKDGGLKQQLLQQQQEVIAALDSSILESKAATDGAAAILSKEWTREALDLRVKEELASRGRKGTDARGIAARLSALSEVSHRFGAAVSVPALVHAITARLDVSRGPDAFLDRLAWKRCARDISTILALLEEDKALRLVQATAEDQADPASATDSSRVLRVVGELSLLVDRLQDEHTKALQHTDPHKTEYMVRIGDEQSLASLVVRAMAYYARVAEAAEQAGNAADVAAANSSAARLAILRLTHMHYKHDGIAAALRLSAAAADRRSEVSAIAASAAAQALADARATAVEAQKAAMAAAVAAAAASGAAAVNAATTKQAQEMDLAAAAFAAARDPKAVGTAAADLASKAALLRGKRGFAPAAAVVARAVVAALAERFDHLLSPAAVTASRSATEIETLADVEAPKALADAEAAGVDLGDLSTAVLSAEEEAAGPRGTAALAGDLAAFVYRFGEKRDKTRAVLMHIFHHALHDRFPAARDLLHMSKLQDRIQDTDVHVQILFNRAMCMLGVAAFRLGQWEDAHSALMEICSTGHVKELLAQGISSARFYGMERDEAQEREERRRLVPYHMHINVELIEACHLISAMLLEVPNIAAAEYDGRRRPVSGVYRKYLDATDAKIFVGPPETSRDAIMMAGLALAEGNWRRAVELLTALRVWSLWSNGRGADRVKQQLVSAVKEAGLVTYLHTYAQMYDSIALSTLQEMFELPARAVSTVVSRLIYSHELPAKLDQPTGTVVLHVVPPTRLHSAAVECADRIVALMDHNEMSFGQRTGQLFRYAQPDDRFRRVGEGGGDGQYRRGGYFRQGMSRGGLGARQYMNAGNRGMGRGGGAGGGGGDGTAKREYRSRGL